ncbi:hypothetical protein [Streptomyces sp. NPDC058755]|uniref:hypothetical protein n=1 Tax=Streptomyces sp. NPDC058755 TaxID=3346624 RepID=UPI0036B9C3E0
MAETTPTPVSQPPDSEEWIRTEARALLGDWLLKILTVAVYLSIPALVLLALLTVHGPFALLAAPLIPAAAGLLVVAHRPWRHAVRRCEKRKEARAQLWTDWEVRRRRKFRQWPF